MTLRCPRIVLAGALAACAGTAPAQVTITLEPTKDNTLYSNAPLGLFSNGTGDRMFCGNSNTGVTRRALIEFDLSSIRSCATILSVELSMTVARTRASVLPVFLHAVSAPWGEGTSVGVGGQGFGGVASAGDATWLHTHNPGTFWTNPGGDFSATTSASTLITSAAQPVGSGASAGRFVWRSTGPSVADVQGWVDDPLTNFGWIIRTLEVGTTTSYAFFTREAAVAADRPSLKVTYTTVGMTSVGTGCTGSGTTPYTMTTNGPPVFPNPGFAFQMSGGPVVSIDAVIMGLTLNRPPLLFGNCLLQINLFPVSIVRVGTGVGVVPMPLPNLLRMECFVLYAQAFGLDSLTSDFATSNALMLQFGK